MTLKKPLHQRLDAAEFRVKRRQVHLDSVPDDFQIDLEITMRKSVAHRVRVNQRYRQAAADLSYGLCEAQNLRPEGVRQGIGR